MFGTPQKKEVVCGDKPLTGLFVFSPNVFVYFGEISFNSRTIIRKYISGSSPMIYVLLY